MEMKPWLKHYPEGVNAEIDPNRYSSLLALMNEAFQKYKDLPAYENMGKSITYGELDDLSKKFAAYLQQYTGLKKGDRVAIQMPNLLQYPVAMYGVLRAGMIVVNTNPLYTEREMKHQFNDAGVKAIVILSNFASKLQNILADTSIEHIFVTNIGDMLGFPKKLIVNAVVKYIKKMVPAFSIPQAIPFNQAIGKTSPGEYKEVKVTGEDIAYLQYTGGTTGVSKGAMLTHRNIVSNLEQTGQWLKPKLVERKEIVITALPLYHIFSLTVNALTMLKIGARNILITNPRDMPGFVKELRKHQFTIFTGVNTLYNGLLNQADFPTLDFSKLKVSIGGGMAVQQAVAKRWKEVTGCPLLEGYGLTETSPVLCCNPLDGSEHVGTIGLPFPSTEVKIIDENGIEQEVGEVGELVACGPQVMKGYWQREDETQKSFWKEGWFKTGDVAMMEPDGFFKIVDRKKDMILVSGFNVYPNEVEDVIMEHPKVLEAAAIGVPDSKSTEAVKVFIVKKDESLTEEELKSFCKEQLTAYKVPRYYEFKTELPKTNVGKILRRALKEQDA
ncbi:AMP-binding protein [Rapidithrix thailandica]|uniref:Long-chain-fatty-acid--CoA ligase n=1 Tax=Rapidithrix thailandica TaxID=413964 RepID=A0AAW9S009_9BACT